jgi:LysR family glycine cleavage system transcriptional activator
LGRGARALFAGPRAAYDDAHSLITTSPASMRSARSLPALVSLRAFEAAARRMSFSLAAQELFVTQSAISHHIQRLEAELGVALFERLTRAVALTAAGQAYYERVHAAFELLRLGTDEVRAPETVRQTLRVGLLASFATRWLAPRLAAFAAAHPDIDLQLQPDIGLADVAGGEVDVAIRYGRGVWPGVRARLIMAERLSVVCSPALIAGRKRPRAPQDLLRFPLLASHARHPFEWDAWARHHGAGGARHGDGPSPPYRRPARQRRAGGGPAERRARSSSHRLVVRDAARRAWRSGTALPRMAGAGGHGAGRHTLVLLMCTARKLIGQGRQRPIA